MRLLDKLKIKFTMFILKTVQYLIQLNIKMTQWKANSLEYLKHPTAEGFKPNK